MEIYQNDLEQLAYMDSLYLEFENSVQYVEENYDEEEDMAKAEMKRALDYFETYCDYFEKDEDLQTEDNELNIEHAKERIIELMTKMHKIE